MLENGLRALLISDYSGPTEDGESDEGEEEEEEEDDDESEDGSEDGSEEDDEDEGIDDEDDYNEGKKKKGNAEKQVQETREHFIYTLFMFCKTTLFEIM